MGTLFLAKKYSNGVYVTDKAGRGFDFNWYEDVPASTASNAHEITLKEARDMAKRWIGFCPKYRAEDGIIYRTMSFGSRSDYVEKGWVEYHPRDLKVERKLKKASFPWQKTITIENGIIAFDIVVEYSFTDKGHENVCSETRSYSFPCSEPRGISTCHAQNWTVRLGSKKKYEVYIHLAQDPCEEKYSLTRDTETLHTVYKGRCGDTEYYGKEPYWESLSEGRLNHITDAAKVLPPELRQEFQEFVSRIPARRKELEEERKMVALYHSDCAALEKRAHELIQKAIEKGDEVLN